MYKQAELSIFFGLYKWQRYPSQLCHIFRASVSNTLALNMKKRCLLSDTFFGLQGWFSVMQLSALLESSQLSATQVMLTTLSLT